jgi:hypothetical protein
MAIKPCLCGHMPKLLKGARDRDLHPEVPRLRYSCGVNRDSHVVCGPWVEAPYLGWTHDHPDLLIAAEESWNRFIEGRGIMTRPETKLTK